MMNNIKQDWRIAAVDREGARFLYTFSSELFPDIVEVKISVSSTFRNPEETAWKILSETVK